MKRAGLREGVRAQRQWAVLTPDALPSAAWSITTGPAPSCSDDERGGEGSMRLCEQCVMCLHSAQHTSRRALQESVQCDGMGGSLPTPRCPWQRRIVRGCEWMDEGCYIVTPDAHNIHQAVNLCPLHGDGEFNEGGTFFANRV